MKHDYVLETDRLILRPMTPDDAEAVFAWVSDPEVNRFMPYALYTSVDQAREWLSTLDNSSDYDFGFVRKSDGLLIGSGGIGPQGKKYWAFGYNIRRDCWNCGYTTEAARAMVDFTHTTFGATDFIANHATENPASGRVMEHIGMTFSHYGEYSTFDKTETFPCKYYTLHLGDAGERRG